MTTYPYTPNFSTSEIDTNSGIYYQDIVYNTHDYGTTATYVVPVAGYYKISSLVLFWGDNSTDAQVAVTVSLIHTNSSFTLIDQFDSTSTPQNFNGFESSAVFFSVPVEGISNCSVGDVWFVVVNDKTGTSSSVSQFTPSITGSFFEGFQITGGGGGGGSTTAKAFSVTTLYSDIGSGPYSLQSGNIDAAQSSVDFDTFGAVHSIANPIGGSGVGTNTYACEVPSDAAGIYYFILNTNFNVNGVPDSTYVFVDQSSLIYLTRGASSVNIGQGTEQGVTVNSTTGPLMPTGGFIAYSCSALAQCEAGDIISVVTSNNNYGAGAQYSTLQGANFQGFQIK